MIIETEFHAEVIPYIESCILRGKSIAKYIHEKFQIPSAKRIFAYLPLDFSDRDEFGLFERDVSTNAETWDCSIEFISAFLKESPNHIVVFEHPYALAGDEFLNTTEQNYFVFRSEVYSYLRSLKNDYASIERLLAWSAGYPLIGILSSISENDIINRLDVDVSVVERLVDNISVVMLGVYDNEALLFLEKPT